MKVFNTVQQITDQAAYKKTMKSGLKKVLVAPEKFLYVDKFKFNGNKVGPLLLVGEVAKDVLAEIKGQMTTPAVEGKVKRTGDTQLSFAPKKGNIAAVKLNTAIKIAGGDDEPIIGALDENEESVGRAKDEREAELEKLRNRNAGTAFQNKKEDARSAITNMLQRTGRSEEAGVRDARRDEMAGEILGKMEKSVNERNKVLDASKPEAHHVSAHGPNSDQVSRLVSGHRNDEILHDASMGTLPAKKVKLTGNADVGDVEVPEYEKVGEGASNISGAFNSNTVMLHAIEEAYSQVAQLEAYISSALRVETEKEYARVMELPAAKTSLQRLQIARKVVAYIQKELKKPNLTKKQIQSWKAKITQLEDGAKVDYDNLQKTIEGNTVKPTLTDEFNVGSERLARTVKPGTTGEKGFAEDGLGTGFEIDKAQGKQASGTDVAQGGKTTSEVMQERYDKIKTTEGQSTAKVVMDPAYVDDGHGGKRRAGWDVQTAYPVNDQANQAINAPGGAEAFVGLVKKIKEKEAEVTAAREEEKKKKAAYEAAIKKFEKADGAITAKENSALPNLQKRVDATRLAHTQALGTDNEAKTEADLKKAELSYNTTVAAIAQAKIEAKKFEEAAEDLRVPAEQAKLQLDKLVGELEALQAQKE